MEKKFFFLHLTNTKENNTIYIYIFIYLFKCIMHYYLLFHNVLFFSNYIISIRIQYANQKEKKNSTN